MPPADPVLEVRRDPDSDEILARGGDPAAHSALQRAGFVPVSRLHESYHRAPLGLSRDDEHRLAADAVAQLRAAGYHVNCDEDFDTGRIPARYLPLGSEVAHLAARIRQATTTQEASDLLTELTASHDGLLTTLEDILHATAEFHDGLGERTDPHTARRLRDLADEQVNTVRADLAHTRDALADRHAPHPARRTCVEEVPATEPERSAVCACPPPPPTMSAAPPPVAGGPRR